MGISFEWTLKFGDVLTLGGAFIVAIGIVLTRVRDDTKLQTAVTTAITEISELKQEFKKFGEILIGQARFDERLTGIDRRVSTAERRIDELAHGEGFVRGRLGIDREYPPSS